MPTSSIDTRLIDDYLSGKQKPDESLLFDAKLLLYPEMADTLYWQRKTNRLVTLFGRQQTKAELEEVEHLLFNDTAYLNFKQRILKIFRR